MANHYTVVGLCGRESSDALPSLDNVDLCELVMPLPNDLRGIMSCDTPYRLRHRKTGEIWKRDCDGLLGSAGENPMDWIREPLTEARKCRLMKKYGAITWADWCPINWGTPRGTYGTKIHKLGGDGSPVLVEFQCNWRPPLPAVMRKIDRYLNEYGLVHIKWIGHNPYDGRTYDVSTAG